MLAECLLNDLWGFNVLQLPCEPAMRVAAAVGAQQHV